MQNKPTVLLIDEFGLTIARMAERLHLLAEDAYELDAMSATDFLARPYEGKASLMIVPSSLREPCLDVKACPPLLFWQEESSSDQGDMEAAVPRFQGARQVDRLIRHHLADRVKGSPSGPGPRHLGCHLSFSSERGETVTRRVINQEMESGRQVVYLPVKPLYLVTDSFRRGPGQTVGDLLCLIAAGDLPQARELGGWLYLHEEGYLTFRLPDRAEDLLTCDTGYLKQLVYLCGAYARGCTESTMVWLDTAGLPLNKLQAIAGLCDHIHVDIPPGDSPAARMARRELGIFLAALPPSCAILEQDAGFGDP